MVAELENAFRGTGIPDLGRMQDVDVRFVSALLAQCPQHHVTPLLEQPELATTTGIRRLTVKDERQRMGLGSFKALGAAYAIAREAEAVGGEVSSALQGRTYVTASAGNHGLSVAAGAQIFGAAAVIYLAQTVPSSFAAKLESRGARVVIEGDDYEASMEAASKAADNNGWTLLSDGSWPGYVELPYRVMEGYRQIAVEIVDQIDAMPTHVLLQAGVGGLAAALAAQLRMAWGDAPKMIVVEPAAAPALQESIRAGRVVETTGPVSEMGRLDCKTPSMLALSDLACDADTFITITEEEASTGTDRAAHAGMQSTPSGAAGLAALFAGISGIGPDAHVLCILSEGAEDA